MTPALAIPIGSFVLGKLHFLGSTCLLMVSTIKESFTPPYYPRLIIDQIYYVGTKSLILIVAAALTTGMVMSLQFGLGLEKFGATLYVPHVVGLSIVKEMGPVFTSLMFAARVGAGITSEISSMTITQQIDAIRALGTSPIKKIVIPRVIACVIALPILTLIANVVGIMGAIAVGTFELKLDPQFFMMKISATVSLFELLSGLMKTFFFAIFVVFTACYYGLNVEKGTRGVGVATTKAVVTSSLLIVVGDFFLSKLFWEFSLWMSLK